MEEMFRFADALGPAKIVHIHVPGVGLKAIVVIDNVACGPAIGGVRMAPDVSVEECVRLARAMTLKNAAAGLPHGGGKSVIFGESAHAGCRQGAHDARLRLRHSRPGRLHPRPRYGHRRALHGLGQG